MWFKNILEKPNRWTLFANVLWTSYFYGGEPAAVILKQIPSLVRQAMSSILSLPWTVHRIQVFSTAGAVETSVGDLLPLSTLYPYSQQICKWDKSYLSRSEICLAPKVFHLSHNHTRPMRLQQRHSLKAENVSMVFDWNMSAHEEKIHSCLLSTEQ